MARLSIRGLPKGVIFASAIVIGSLVPDIDHFILSSYRSVYGKGYGHIIYIPLGLAVLSGLAVAYFGRRDKVEILR